MYIKKNINKIIYILIIIALLSCTVLGLMSCSEYNNYEKFYIPYLDPELQAVYHTRLTLIKSQEDLEKYFTQEDYITIGESYDNFVEKFDEEFFKKYVLIPALIDDNAKLTIKKGKSIIKLIYSYNNECFTLGMPSLKFLRVPVNFIGDKTVVLRENRFNY